MNYPQITANLPYIFESTGYYSPPSSYQPAYGASSTSSAAPFVGYDYSSASYMYTVPNYSPELRYTNDVYGRPEEGSSLQRARARHGNVGTEELVGRARAAKDRSRGYGRDRARENAYYQSI